MSTALPSLHSKKSIVTLSGRAAFGLDLSFGARCVLTRKKRGWSPPKRAGRRSKPFDA